MSRDESPPNDVDPALSDGIPRSGEVIASKYEVERVLGVGGMGVVLAARHLQLGQRVAIKFIRGEAAEDASAVGRFLREARAAVALSSEHVTKVLDVGTLETGAPYMVMEYLDGIDLGEVLRRQGAMTVADAVGNLLQACEALAEAHALGIVHRDLKPSNLFVTHRRDGTPLVKVLDFGISKMTGFNVEGSREALTASGLVMGSPGYMSPEQVRNAKAADARSDIWALGVILYELLTGVAPFAGDTMGETFARIIADTPTPIRQLRPDVPEGLAAAITQCWQRDLARRTQSVGELAANLSPFAPREAALSVERILRICRPPGGVNAFRETLAAPNTVSAFPFEGGYGGTPSGRIERQETGQAWLQSGSLNGIRPESARRRRRLVAGLGVIVAIAGVVAIVAVVRGGPVNVVASRVEPPSTPPAAVAAPAGNPPANRIGIGASDTVTNPEPWSNTPASDEGDAGLRAAPRPRDVKPNRAPPVQRASSKPGNDPGLEDLLDRRQ